MGRIARGKDLVRGLWRGMNRLKQDGDLEGATNRRLPLHSTCVYGSRSVTPNSDTPRTVARQVSPSLGFSRQEYWSGLPCPTPGHLPDPGIQPVSPALAGGFFNSRATYGYANFLSQFLKLTDDSQEFIVTVFPVSGSERHPTVCL